MRLRSTLAAADVVGIITLQDIAPVLTVTGIHRSGTIPMQCREQARGGCGLAGRTDGQTDQVQAY